MGTDVRMVEAGLDAKPLVGLLLELNAYELSRFDGADVDRDGEYGYPYLGAYWTESERHPFLTEVDGKVAGLVLVRTGPPRSIAELLVLPRFRRAGVGTVAARAAFTRFPGDWEVHQLPGNDAAVAFWRRAIPVAFDETVDNDGTTQRFCMSGRDVTTLAPDEVGGADMGPCRSSG